jgi:hypothetical protein
VLLYIAGIMQTVACIVMLEVASRSLVDRDGL